MKLKTFSKQIAVISILVLLVIFFAVAAKGFGTIDNFLSLLKQVSILGTMSIGMTFVLICGGIDLSVGSQISIVGVVTALFITELNVNPILACVIGIMTAMLISSINGIIVIKTGVSSMIVTLAMMQVVQGVNYMITNGVPIYGFPDYLKTIAQGYVGPIPVPVIIMLCLVIAGSFFLNRTYYGRYFYATGGNPEAARLSGLNINKIRLISFLASGLLIGIAGLIMMARVASGQPNVGQGYEMDVLTACVVGGIALSGGSGGIFGMFLGVLIIGVLSNGLGVMGVGSYAQTVCKGLVLILVVSLDGIRQKRLLSQKMKIVETTTAGAGEKE